MFVKIYLAILTKTCYNYLRNSERYLFSVQDYFSSPAIALSRANTTITPFEEIKYNSFGYRTHEFDSITDRHIVVGGCSHTEGVGLHLEQTWVKQLEKELSTQIINLGAGGSNADFVSQNLTLWLQNHTHKLRPHLVIAQWPNLYRATHWKNSKSSFVNNTCADELFKQKILQGDEHFLLTFVKNVVYLDNICKLGNVPVIHIYLDTPGPEQILIEQVGINMHYDMKIPGETWHFDRGAFDNQHHSEWCHTQWVKRIRGLSW